MAEDQISLKPLGERGQTGLRRYSGYIREEFLTELQGRRGVQTYKEMQDNDDVIGAVLFAILNLIRQTKWSVELPPDPQPIDKEREAFLESCFQDMEQSWSFLLPEILSFLSYGWSFHEVVYKIRSGRNSDPRLNSRFDDQLVGWRDMPIRGQDSLLHWEFASDQIDLLTGFTQLPAPSYRQITIPMSKGALFRPMAHKNNPEGRSILRNAYKSYYMKNFITNIEGIGLERDLAGLPVLYAPPRIMQPNASDADKALYTELQKVIVNLKRDEQEGLILPSAYDSNGNRMYDLQLLSSGGSRQINTSEIVERYDRRIAMTVMADFLFIGHSATGSYALIDNKTDIFAVAIKSFVDAVAEIFNRKLIPALWIKNGWETDRVPKWVPSDIESPDLEKLGTYISQLSSSGFQLFDKKTESFLRKAAGLPVESFTEEDFAGEDDMEETPKPDDSNTGQTTEDGEVPHHHTYTVDDSGNGLTQSTSTGAAHTHTIIDGAVLEHNGHTHRLK
jgi:hypothetical protein